MIAIILLTLISLFTPVFGLDNAFSTALSNAMPALIVFLLLVALVSPFAYLTVHRLRLEANHANRKLRHSKATIESLSHRYILRANRIRSLQEHISQLHHRCLRLEPRAKVAESLVAHNKILETKLNLSLITIDELRSNITTMAAQQARTTDDAQNFKDLFDEANQQKLVFERRAQVAAGEAVAMAKTMEDSLHRVHELECGLEEKDTEMHDARCWAKKVGDLEGRVEDLEEENKTLRYLVYEYQINVAEKTRAIQLEEANRIIILIITDESDISMSDIQAIQLEQVSTRNIAFLAIPIRLNTNTTKHINLPARQSTQESPLPIHIIFSSSATTSQASAKPSRSYHSVIEGSAPPTPSMVSAFMNSDINDSDRDCSLDTGASASGSSADSAIPSLVSDTEMNGSDDLTLSPDPIFTEFPLVFRRHHHHHC